jgi:hypothetical protein
MGESAASSWAPSRGKVKQTFSIWLIGRGPGGSWAHLPIPFNVEKTFGAKGRVAVRGTINGVAYRSSIMPRGDGTHYMAVNQTIRAAAGAGIGDTVKVVMEPDTATRTVTVPPYLKTALAAAAHDNERSSGQSQRQFIWHRGDYAAMAVCACGGDAARSAGDPILVDESLEQIVPETIQAGDIVGISVHTGNALRGYQVGRMARAAARGWSMAAFTPRCFPKRRWSAARRTRW